jgi:hypothetical protein
MLSSCQDKESVEFENINLKLFRNLNSLHFFYFVLGEKWTAL